MTVTVNAALDKTLDVPNMQLGQRHRCPVGEVLAGGKGINVARALMALGEPVVATGLAGGKTGTRIVEELTREGMLNDFVRIEDESRTSLFLNDPASGSQTEIYEYGPEVEERELAMLQAKLQYLAPSATAFVLTGSLPRRVPADWYALLVRELRRREVTVVVDSAGEPLRAAVLAGASLIAPNQPEAEELVGYEFQGDADFANALDEIVEMGARGVLISHSGGLFAAVRDGGRLRRLQVAIDPIEPVSTAGAGDALLAAFLAGHLRGKPLEESLTFAVACGTASVCSSQPGRFEVRDATRFQAKARLLELAAAA